MSLNLGVIEQHRDVNQSTSDDIVVDWIDQHCNVTLESTAGQVTINQKIDQHCSVFIKAKTGISIGQKIDQHCGVTLWTDGPVSIGQKIDQHSNVDVEAGGPIDIGQKIDGNSSAKLVSDVSIFVGQKIDGNSDVRYSTERLLGRGRDSERVHGPRHFRRPGPIGPRSARNRFANRGQRPGRGGTPRAAPSPPSRDAGGRRPARSTHIDPKWIACVNVQYCQGLYRGKPRRVAQFGSRPERSAPR